ncbi:MAG TPA: MBL fold metallo-hydrolase [Gemmatimonadaceae bacterium]|nr:MBL fold metallo-hydrolase [Gemmatimonadaceae bacterium]
MGTTLDQPVHARGIAAPRFAAGVERILTVFVNAYMVGAPGEPWVLVDTGLPGFAGAVRGAARRRYGGDARPEAIVLTHGHFDHAGSAIALADEWDVPVYAHRGELPYLTGRSDYPPRDPTVGGALGLMSRTFPTRGVNMGRRVRALPAGGVIAEMPGWRWLHTPGHTAGHVSLYRESDGLLLAGDALATVNQDSALAMVTQRPVLSVPPAPLTTDWGAARDSVRQLAALRPWTIAAGHGRPVSGPDVAEDLADFALRFQPPRRGRYAHEPAQTDHRGVIWVPPPPPDPLPKQLVVAGLVVGAVWALTREKD